MLDPPAIAAVHPLVHLPKPALRNPFPLEEALQIRQSSRGYIKAPLSLLELAQLTWAAAGIGEQPHRTVPSAGALYPIVLFIVAGNISELLPATYTYRPAAHALIQMRPGDERRVLCAAALGQNTIQTAPASLVLVGASQKDAGQYGNRGLRYLLMEAGHAAQNVYLQAAALNLGTVAIGAFEDDEVRRALGLAPTEMPLYIMPVGRIS